MQGESRRDYYAILPSKPRSMLLAGVKPGGCRSRAGSGAPFSSSISKAERRARGREGIASGAHPPPLAVSPAVLLTYKWSACFRAS
eukprot:6177434-Pleurochrysis_carterae.AAC.2